MTYEEIINKLHDHTLVSMPANEWLHFRKIADEIEGIVGMEAHGKEAIKKLESLERLLWAASREYDRKPGENAKTFL